MSRGPWRNPSTRRSAVLAAIMEAAEAGEPCPTNEALAKLAGIRSPQNVSKILRNLEADRLIRSNFGPRQRTITILATGKSTADARDLAEARPSKPKSPQPMPRRACGGARIRTMDGAADAGSGRTAPSAAPLQDRGKSLNPHYRIAPVPPQPPTPREQREEEQRLIAEFARTKGILRVIGRLDTVWTNDQAIAALERMGLKVKRGDIYSKVDGKKVLTNRLIEHANRLMVERQTVRVRQEPEGARA